MQDQRFLRELRCSHCHSLLAREYIIDGRLEIKCKCGELLTFEFKYYKNAKKKGDKIILRQKTASDASEELKAEKGQKQNG